MERGATKNLLVIEVEKCFEKCTEKLLVLEHVNKRSFKYYMWYLPVQAFIKNCAF
jgi:hypothetical protein